MVMHGLVTPEDAKAKTGDIASEFGVQCRHSGADVTKPAEIRCTSILMQDEPFLTFLGPCMRHAPRRYSLWDRVICSQSQQQEVATYI